MFDIAVAFAYVVVEVVILSKGCEAGVRIPNEKGKACQERGTSPARK